MDNEPPVPAVRALWQLQPAEGGSMSVAEVRRKSLALQGKARRQALGRERDVRRDSSWWFTIGPALNILILGLVYVRSPLFHGTIAEVAVLITVLAAHIVVLAVVARRLRDEARACQREIDLLPGASPVLEVS